MNHQELLEVVEESVRLKRSFFDSCGDEVLRAGGVLAAALSRGDKLLIFGNGGSAADAQHFAAELVNRFRDERPALPAIALTTDSSILTSVANDTDFQKTFSRQIEALGRSGDVAIAISTSGTSANVLEAVRVARERGLATLGLAGKDGGELARLADLCLTVPHGETPRIQEIHTMLVHVFCEIIEDALYPGEA